MDKVPVCCKIHGHYDSMSAAGRGCYCTRENILGAIKKNRPNRWGCKWEVVEKQAA
jgi:hypothetical protein